MGETIPLERRLESGDYPVCPIYTLMKDNILRCERLQLDGLNSKYCPDCKEHNPNCELYQNYLALEFLKEKEGR